MGQSVQRNEIRGGIVGLARFTLEHREAIEYDLLTKTGHTVDDIGRTLSWNALDSFLNNLEPTSALVREEYPERSRWCTVQTTNNILADMMDLLAQINANLVAIGSSKPAKQPKPYPRPDAKPKDEKRIGSNGLPPAELEEWFEEMRRKHARNSTSHNNSDAGLTGSTAVPD